MSTLAIPRSSFVHQTSSMQMRKAGRHTAASDRHSVESSQMNNSSKLRTCGKSDVVCRINDGSVDNLRNPRSCARENELEAEVLNLGAFWEQFREKNAKQWRGNGTGSILNDCHHVELPALLETDVNAVRHAQESPERNECDDTVADHGPLAQSQPHSREQPEP